MSTLKQTCRTYETFGDCRFGRNCSRSHAVWPYRTRTAIATIVTEDIELPGVISFLTDSETVNPQTQRCYVSRDRWFSADAGTGDVVEILISEEVHINYGCCYARINKILQNSSKSQIPSLMPAGFCEQLLCLDFMTYRDCYRGERCRRKHDMLQAYKQHFYVAKVQSVMPVAVGGSEVHAVVKIDDVGPYESKRYYIPSKFLCNVAEGHLVIVQESSRIHAYGDTGMHCGKIITILDKSLKLSQCEVPLEICLKSAFAFTHQQFQHAGQHSSSVRRVIIAFSVESCSYHDSCKRIGIHVRAAALGMQKLSEFFVPFHRMNDRCLPNGFAVDTIRFALTVYAHTASDHVEGPFLTPLFIQPERLFTYSNADSPKYQEYLQHMWPLFGAETFIESVATSLSAGYMVDFPNTWKERFLVRQMICFFNAEITKYFRSKEGKFVLVRNSFSGNSIIENSLVIPAEILEMVVAAWQSSSSAPQSAEEREMALGFLVGSANRSGEGFWEKQLSERYTWDAVSCSDIADKQSVITISAIRQAVDFMNQQTLLSVMISHTVTLYSKNEIFGAIAPRYSTPVILRAVIRKLTKTFVYLQLCGTHGRKRGNRPISLGQIFKCSDLTSTSSSQHDSDDANNDDENVDSISFVLENLSSAEYCNSKLVRVSGKHIEALTTTAIVQGITADRTACDVCEVIATSGEVYDAPYHLHDKGTLVTLSRGVELQLQLVLKEDNDDGDNRLRLLRVGNGCHICLIHMNYPTSAFFSGRFDVTSFIPLGSLKLMKERIDKNSLKTVILKDIHVEWKDRYFSGGTFTPTNMIKPRNLLCIRKEITGSGSLSIFVWTCHAVVSEVCDNVVRFLVCSLFQDQTPDMWTEMDKDHYIVEVIDMTEEDVSEQ